MISSLSRRSIRFKGPLGYEGDSAPDARQQPPTKPTRNLNLASPVVGARWDKLGPVLGKKSGSLPSISAGLASQAADPHYDTSPTAINATFCRVADVV